MISGIEFMKAEIFIRGPIVSHINAEPILDYYGGIFDNIKVEKIQNHAVTITGYGFDKNSG